jgi:small subunit ribosomal protein S9
MNNTTILYTGIGKRKTSVAKVFLSEGSGNISINNKTLENFFNSIGEERELLKNPFILTELNNKYDVNVKVQGGGVSAQFDAIQLAIVKAICAIDSEYRKVFNQFVLLRRDSRIKERRKYGLKKARKASQFSKR